MSNGTVQQQIEAIEKQMETAPIEHWRALSDRRAQLLERTMPAAKPRIRRVLITEDDQ